MRKTENRGISQTNLKIAEFVCCKMAVTSKIFDQTIRNFSHRTRDSRAFYFSQEEWK